MPERLAPLVSVASRPGVGGVARDRHLVLANTVAVLDGMSDPDAPPGRDGAWYASLLGAALAARVWDTRTDLADVVSEAIETVAGTYRLTPGVSPSSTLSILRWSDEVVEAYALADSPLGVTLRSGDVHVVRDDRPRTVAQDVVAAQHALLADGDSSPAGGDLIARTREELRSRRNQGGGFWVAEADPQAAYQAVRSRWPADEVRDALITSDGAAAAVDRYGLYLDWPALLAAVRVAGVRQLLKTVTTAESTERDAQGRPTGAAIEPEADATAVHVLFR